MRHFKLACVSMLVIVGGNAYASDGAERLQQRILDKQSSVIVKQQKAAVNSQSIVGSPCQVTCKKTMVSTVKTKS